VSAPAASRVGDGEQVKRDQGPARIRPIQRTTSGLAPARSYRHARLILGAKLCVSEPVREVSQRASALRRRNTTWGTLPSSAAARETFVLDFNLPLLAPCGVDCVELVGLRCPPAEVHAEKTRWPEYTDLSEVILDGVTVEHV